MKYTSMVALALAGLFATTSTVAAQEGQERAPKDTRSETPQRSSQDVDRLIEQLGSEEFRDRRTAERQLREIGEDTRGALEDAIRNSDDPEVRWRAHRVLRSLDQDDSGTLSPRRDVNQPSPLGPRWQGRVSPMSPWQGFEVFPGGGIEDFQQRFEEMERRLDELMREMPGPGAFGMPPGGIGGLQGMGHGTSIQIGPDGVRVEVEKVGEDGEKESEVYEAESLEQFREQYPDVAKRFFPEGGPQVFQFGPGGLKPLDVDRILKAVPFGRIQELDQNELTPLERIQATPFARADGPRLGVMISTLAPEVREFLGIEADRGLLVERVQEGTLAESLGVKPKDVVVSVAGEPVGSPADVTAALRAAEAGSDVEVVVNRMGETVTLSAKMPQPPKAADDGGKLRRVEAR